MYNSQIKLHFIGIGGVGMAGIAEVLLNLGYSVTGSDIKSGKLIEHLQRHGARIDIGHKPENIPGDTNVVVISSAITPENPELLHAREKHIPVIPRAEMLAELMRMKYGVAVAGSHGKTTTTSMTGKILDDAGLDPTVVVGGRVLTQLSGARVGTGQYLVAEADESDGSFCLLNPAIAIVTNIDKEHLSHYQSFGKLEEAFRSFIEKVPFYGLVIACFDDPLVRKMCENLKRRVVSYGINGEYDLVAKNIEVDKNCSNYDLYSQGKFLTNIQLPLPGNHLVSNSLSAIAVGLELGVYAEEMAESLRTFPGVSRRSEIIAQKNGITVIDDYAHHPTEITKTLTALSQGWLRDNSDKQEGGRLICVFQPHRFSRTRELFSDFVNSFYEVDKLYIADIYAAGEEPIEGITSSALIAAMPNENIVHVTDLSVLPPTLKEELKPGDVLVTLGAGNVWQVSHQVAELLV